MILYDPITNEELTVYSQRSHEANESIAEAKHVIPLIAKYYDISIDEAIRRLQNSDYSHPIEYFDEIIWVG